MIARIFSPIVCALIGVLLSVAVGLSVIWQTLDSHVKRTMAVRATQNSNELKKRGWDFWTIEMENLATELRENQDRLKKYEAELNQREVRLESSRHELEKERADLTALQAEISKRVVEISTDEIVNLKQLAQLYSNLPPVNAVGIFREMDDATAVKILSLMKADIVGPIFEQMSKTGGAEGSMAKRAAQLSDKLRLVKRVKPTAAP
jgi:flagellar motility protein MotE (MotC chaperone)